MKKYIYMSLILVICSLTACSFQKGGQVDFDTGDSRTFFYEQKEYTILSQEVSSEELRGNEARFLKLEIEGKSGSRTSLSFHNLYRLADGGMAIGVQDHFYRVKQTDHIEGTDTPLDLSQFTSIATDDAWRLDRDDVRVLICDGRRYRISDELIAEDKLGEWLAVLGTVQLFNAKTGKSIPPNKWGKMDWSGETLAKEERLYWTYGSIYSLQYQSIQEVVVIEINGDYHLARRE